MKRKLFFIIFIALLFSLLYACEVDIVRTDTKVSNISVDGVQQYYYFVGDNLNFGTAMLYIQYEDGSIDEVPLEDDMVDSSFNTDKPGVVPVKINYKNVSTSFNIEVLDLIIESVEIGAYPKKDTYIEGTDFDVTGGIIKVKFEGGRTVSVPMLPNNVAQYDPDIVGYQTVKIKYRTETLDVPITVVAKELQAVSVKTPPTRKAVYVGHAIDPSGMVLSFHYNNGKVEDINSRYVNNLEFVFDNTKATPSTEVTLRYTKQPENELFTAVFKIQVLYRRWKSMVIKQYPVTNGILLEPAQYDETGKIVRNEVRTPSTSLQNIIQGDTINLSSGIVEVTFDDGSKQNYLMSDNLLKVYNVLSTEKSEIKGLTITTLEKKDVPAGDCTLEYKVRLSETLYDYDSDPAVKVTAVNSSGAAVPVIKSGENSLIEVRSREIYTVTVTASVNTIQEIDGVNQQVTHITSRSFKIYGVGAVEPRRTLDISSAGDYQLTVIYMEDPNWSIPLSVKVVSRAPVSMELSNYTDITNKDYIVGDKINIAFVKYRMIYDNGDKDPWTPVEARMLSPDISLDCTQPTTAESMKAVRFSLYGVDSINLNVKVLPLTVVYLEIDPPTNTYVAQGASINPSGGIMTAYMNNNTKAVYALDNIIGEGYERAQILNDPLSNGNSIVRENHYTATIIFKGAQSTFEYYVSDRIVATLSLVRDGTEKTSYFQNEPLDFRGLSLRVTWKNNPNAADVIPVTEDMLYRYDPYVTGPKSLNFRYRGIVDSSFSIIVIPKQVIEISIVQNPKTIYVYGVDGTLDLTGIRINKRHNDGTTEEQIGITLQPEGSGSYGWSYNRSQINFRLYGQTQTVVLSYRDYYNQTAPIQVSYEIEVVLNEVEAIFLSDPDDPSAPPSDLVATVSKGTELNLLDKYIYVKFKNISEIRRIPLTAQMINYEPSDITLGDRAVLITYNGVSKKAYVRVLNSFLQSIILEKTPKVNYMLKEMLDLTGGTVRRVFRYVDSDETWWDIMPMLVDGITVSGFDANLTEADYASDEPYKQRMITITYMGLSYSYNIKIYKKINAVINYFSTISFYGDVSMPYASVDTRVAGYEDAASAAPGYNAAGFLLPHIETYYINLSDIIYALPAGFDEVPTLDGEGNIRYTQYQSGGQSYIKVIRDNGATGYIDEHRIMTSANYPTSPAQGANRYLILVKVEGNRYYNALNYAQKEFKIINKFINVITVVPNEDAVVWRFNTSDNARAVYLVSNYIEHRTLSDGSLNMVLASPTAEGFEVVVIRWGANDLNALKTDIADVITKSWWSYSVPVTDSFGNPVYDAYGNPLIKIFEIQQTNAPEFPDPIQKKVEVISLSETRGVNYRIYGEGADRLSYYVPSGGLIAVRDEQDFFVIELFTGYLYREDFNSGDVMYEVGGVPISGFYIEADELANPTAKVSGYSTRIDQGGSTSLKNPNYFINFQSQRYVIAPKEIIEVEFTEAGSELYEYQGELYYIVRTGVGGGSKKVLAKYRDTEGGALKLFDEDEIRYYHIVGGTEIALERGEFPTDAGLYRARITHNYKAKLGYGDTIVWECLLEITG